MASRLSDTVVQAFEAVVLVGLVLLDVGFVAQLTLGAVDTAELASIFGRVAVTVGKSLEEAVGL